MDIPIQYTRKQVENFNNSSIQTVQQRAEAPDPIPTAGSLHEHWEDNNTVLPTLSRPLSTSGEFLFYGSTRVLRETKTYWLVPCLPNRELMCNCTGGEKKKQKEKKGGVKHRFGGERLHKSPEELGPHVLQPSVMFRELGWNEVLRADQASCTQLLFHVMSIPIPIPLLLQL